MTARVLFRDSARFSAAPGCPMCAGKGEVYDPEAEGMLLCFCRQYGIPPKHEPHCVRCVTEARGLIASISCQWCKPGDHRLCEAHK